MTPATCGACGGGHLGVLGPDETCITATTRNFKGRMGDPGARIYMGSVRNNITTGKTLPAIGLPPRLLDLLKAGGIYPLLERDGLIAPRPQSKA